MSHFSPELEVFGTQLGFPINLSFFFFDPQPLTADLHYYYILELSFYWSLMFSQFTDIKRKVSGVGLGLQTHV